MTGPVILIAASLRHGVRAGPSRRAAGLLLAALLFGAARPGALRGQENGECLACHAEKTLSVERGGKSVSLFMDETALSASVHAGLSCVMCHEDLQGTEFPHAEGPGPARCGTCHAGQSALFEGSLHGRALARGDPLAPRCQNCHGGHDIRARGDPKSSVAPMRVPFVCGSCHREGASVQKQRSIHQDHILENYSESIHGEGLLKKGLSVSATCSSCHTAHNILPHTNPGSSIARSNIAKTCKRCHDQIEVVHRKVIKGELWQKDPRLVPACTECHQPHKVRKVFYDQGAADRDCLACHGKRGLRARDGRLMTVEKSALDDSAHLRTACAQCHSDVTPSHARPCDTIAKKVACANCHQEQAERFQTSTHGRLLQAGDHNAPTCIECHGTHAVLGRDDTRSPVFAMNVPALCSRCHQEGNKAAVRRTGADQQHDILPHYLESIHGKGLLKSGLVVTAMCSSCHRAHGELPASDPASSVNKANVAVTCSACHLGVYKTFVASVHSPDRAEPGQDLPSCSDCHTAHSIKRADEGHFKLEVMGRCGRCHTDVAKTYFETYHGKVSQLGYAKTAKCHDCHGAHNILPIADPRSTLNRENIVETCRKCHAGATRRFAGYLSHATHHDPKKYPLIFWTFWLMTALLVGTFGTFGLHTLLWIPRAFQLRRLHPRLPTAPGEKLYVRFSRFERSLHFSLILSFMALAVTGMTLKFSYTKWAVFLARALGGFETAGLIHRVAAVVMLAVFGSHLWDLFRRRRLKAGSWRALLGGPDSLLPTMRDARELWATLRWYLGLGDRPSYGRWTYWEKFDYFAVFWGVAIIGSSGLLLWFPEVFTRLLPGWLINVATIVHSDEALLAVGFIFTVHFFNTHFRPDKFPMDTVIFTGRMSLEELRRERPEEYERLRARLDMDASLAPPLSPGWMRVIRLFAWTALGVGFTLIFAILYAMLFAYK